MIEVQDLRKRFGTKVAVDGVTFSVKKGEVLGFLGPNGAGKSTTMRMVTGFFPPTSGGVKVGGLDMLENPLEAKKKIGYLPENAPLYSDMSVVGFLGFCAELRGLFGKAKKDAIERVLDLCHLHKVHNQSVDTLSKGYRHRTCFAQSIIHDPDVLILDEPTDGLDPNQKHEVRGMIKRMGENKAIIFSTHILEEVDAACSRAIIIDRGRIVADGTPQQLKQRAPQAGSVTIRLERVPAASLKDDLKQVENVREAQIEGTLLRVFPKRQEQGAALAHEVLRFCAAKGISVDGLQTEEGRLDEVFRALTKTDE